MADALLRQARRNALEIAGELAEHQHAVALLEQVGQLLNQVVTLDRRHPGVGFRINQRGIKRQTAQQGQRLEDREPVLVHILQQTQHLLAFTLQVRVIDAAVTGSQRQVHARIVLRRKLCRHQLLGAAQHERADAPAQTSSRRRGVRRVLTGLRRASVQVTERTGGGEQSVRHNC